MIWSRLKNFECPHCKTRLVDLNDKHSGYKCSKCEFSITTIRFEQIVQSLYDSGKKFTIDDFTNGSADVPDEHDAFWLNPKAHE